MCSSDLVPLLDQPEGSRVIVRLRDGRELRGELVSDGFDTVIARIEGMRTSLPRAQVLAVEMEVPFEERLARFRARIPADAWDVRLELVRWLLAERHPEIALEELREIRKNADSDDAARLMARAEAERDLMRSAGRARGDVRMRRTRDAVTDFEAIPAHVSHAEDSQAGLRDRSGPPESAEVHRGRGPNRSGFPRRRVPPPPAIARHQIGRAHV